MIYYLLFLHFFADFILQSREMGQKKSSELKFLAQHIGIIFLVFMAGAPWLAPKYSLYNALIHAVIDWHIWKVYKWGAHKRIERSKFTHPLYHSELAYKGERWEYWKDHLFYATIGFDQMLHIMTIFFVYKDVL